MYAVVNHLRLGSAIAADVWAEAQEQLPRLMREVEGFEAFYVIEVSDEQVVLVIVADTAETLDRIATEVGNTWMRENVLQHLTGPPERLVGKIVASSGL